MTTMMMMIRKRTTSKFAIGFLNFKFQNLIFISCCCAISESGTDDEDKKKLCADWAKPAQLKEALERQYGLDGSNPVDPDLIFPEVHTCNLEEIFGCKGGHSRP